jgi:hypothetical protein
MAQILKIGEQIETLRITDNREIKKTLTIKKLTGSQIAFRELKGNFNIHFSPWSDAKITFFRNNIYLELIK